MVFIYFLWWCCAVMLLVMKMRISLFGRHGAVSYGFMEPPFLFIIKKLILKIRQLKYFKIYWTLNEFISKIFLTQCFLNTKLFPTGKHSAWENSGHWPLYIWCTFNKLTSSCIRKNLFNLALVFLLVRKLKIIVKIEIMRYFIFDVNFIIFS